MNEFKNIIADIKKQIINTWEPDERFPCCFATIEYSESVSARTLLVELYDNAFDHRTIKKSSKQEKQLAKIFSGVSKDQYLFTTTIDEITIYCAWWPWGDKSNVSLRIGLFSLDDSKLNEEDAIKTTKTMLGVK